MQLDFEEQWHFINDDGIPGNRMLPYSFFGQRTDARVDDGFEFLSTVAITENDGAKFLPVDSLIRLQDAGAERIDDLLPSNFAGFDNLAG